MIIHLKHIGKQSSFRERDIISLAHLYTLLSLMDFSLNSSSGGTILSSSESWCLFLHQWCMDSILFELSFASLEDIIEDIYLSNQEYSKISLIKET